MNVFKTLVLALVAMTMSAVAFGSELDEKAAPAGVLVRVKEINDKAAEVTIFKAAAIDQKTAMSEKTAAAAVQSVAKAENELSKIAAIDLNSSSELDRDQSTQAWYYYYYGNYWSTGSYFNYWYTPYSYYTYNWSTSYYYAGYRWYWYF